MKSCYKLVAIAVMLGVVIFSCVNGAQAQDLQGKVKQAMKMLQDKCLELGVAKLDSGTLIYGETEMNGNYDVVDEVADNNGCTATLFVASDGGFKRIATNVIKDGNRAVGTMLDPNGQAIKQIRNGDSFYGAADILGEAYETGYEPVKDASGAIIGVYYVGYKK